MKKTGLILLAAILLIVGAGCVTTNTSVLTAERDPIALVGMVSNMYVFWHEEEPIGPEPIGFVIPRAFRRDPDLVFAARADEIINTAEIMFRDALADSPLINLAEREAVLSSRTYQNARIQRRQAYDEMTMPTGYRFVDIRDRDFFSALARETGIQRSMFVEFDFTKAMSGGMAFGKSGNMRAELAMRVSVLDAQGRVIFRKSYTGWSDSTIEVSGGMYSQIGLTEIFESALGEVIFEFLYDLNW